MYCAAGVKANTTYRVSGLPGGLHSHGFVHLRLHLLSLCDWVGVVKVAHHASSAITHRVGQLG